VDVSFVIRRRLEEFGRSSEIAFEAPERGAREAGGPPKEFLQDPSLSGTATAKEVESGRQLARRFERE